APFEEEVRGFEKAGSMLAAAGKKRMNELLDDAARVITVSSALAGYLAERYGVKKEKITVTPNCVDPGAVNVSPAKAEQLRRKYFPGKKTVIGFVGSIFPYHGVDILIRAFAELHRQHSETGLFIVGDGYLIPELKELASALGCGDSVVFTGSVPHADIFDHIAAMDITVMADSNWYGSPVKIFEYGCAGKPVIAPDTVPVRDVMENGTDGLLVKPGKNELLSALLQMMNDPEKTSGMARHFREKIVSTCTWKRAAEKALLSL
ncbi:MAG TPA: glycosyltransferase family 4 protein, partial [Bacteroidia bacterium]|nr:glycosyltransferase family 4 protein [Bacteroidia bacterium]